MKLNQLLRKIRYLPAVCIILFILFYVLATFYYPGGSFKDKNSIGFSWKENYWCELISPIAKNGKINNAYSMALCATIILLVGISIFWIVTARTFINSLVVSTAIIVCGIASMIIGLLLYLGKYHDAIMNIAGLFGMIAFVLLLFQMRAQQRQLFLWGCLCVASCLFINTVYYTGLWIEHLGWIQKLTFLIFLSWFLIVNIYAGRILSKKQVVNKY